MAEGFITRRGGENVIYGTFEVPGTGDTLVSYITIPGLAGKKHWFLMLEHGGGGKANNGVSKINSTSTATVLGLYYNDGTLLCYYELNGKDYISNETLINVRADDGHISGYPGVGSNTGFYFKANHTFTYVAW